MGRIFQNKLVGFHEYAERYVCGQETIYTEIKSISGGFSERVPIRYEPKYNKPIEDIIEEYDKLKAFRYPILLSNFF